jgi:GT2 family glycosyltransferase
MSNIRPTLALGIPTINRKDLLEEALAVYAETFKHRHIYIIDNGNQEISENPPQIKVFNAGTNLGVAASWNAIIERQAGLGYTHILILNDDVVLHRKAQEIEAWLEHNPADFYHCGSYCSFIIPFKTYQTMGKFDENYYPAYYEDTDYNYRLKLAEANVVTTEIILPEVLRTSKSGEKDKSLYDKVFECRKHYEQKWGGAPTHETFTTPFNQ